MTSPSLGPHGLAEQCPSVRRRAAFDARRGHTTSQRAIDFIRRTCPCDSCAIGRLRVRTTLEHRPPAAPSVGYQLKGHVDEA